MNVKVQRYWSTGNSVTGMMTVDGEFIAFTLEPPYGDVKPYAIPAGTYDLTIRFSPRFKRIMPHVENVPGFEGILIHVGNYPKDTEGCTLVGKARGDDFVANSKVAFDELFGLLFHNAERDGDVYKVGSITYQDMPHLVAA